VPSVSPGDPASHILVVDDDEGLLILMAEALRAEGFDVATATSAKAARAALAERTPDLVILDLKLQDGQGPGLAANILRDRAGVPFIVVTGQGDEKVAVEVMKQGARDYVMKDTGLLDLLPAVVRRTIAAVAQQQALAAAQEERKQLEGEIVSASERERQSIGADLHDNLGQQLTALELMCTTLKEDVAAVPEVARRVDIMCKMLREAIAQTRFLARGLVPVGRDPDALQIGLAELAERINSLRRIACHFECPAPVSVSDPAVAGHLFRIAQEAVNNAMKHARAKVVTIRLHQMPDRLCLEIMDDGSGLTRAKNGKSQGIGLGVMKHRASVIGADLSVISKRGAGVTIRCVLPLKK
jgi:signal transduction histidine kinase